jgi:hypothetical protein
VDLSRQSRLGRNPDSNAIAQDIPEEHGIE